MSASPNAALARPLSAPESERTSRASRNVALGYLRTFAVILVLAHHTVARLLSRVPAKRTSLLEQPRWWKGFPIFDSHRWTGFAIFAVFNDMFFMSLLFFLSGLFVWNSLERKGTRTFMRDRMLRLALPFIFAAAIVAPLAYYPAYAIRNAGPERGGLHAAMAVTRRMAGRSRMVHLGVAGVRLRCCRAFRGVPKFGERLGRLSSNANRHPARFFLLLIGMSALVYVPMVIPLGPDYWTAIGPFHFQTSRIFHYAVYFFMGVGVGAYGVERGLLAPDGMLARHWLRWTIAMPLAFIPVVAWLVSLPLRSREPCHRSCSA